MAKGGNGFFFFLSNDIKRKTIVKVTFWVIQDKVLYKIGADHFLQGLSKGIPIKKSQKKFTVYSPNHLKNALSAVFRSSPGFSSISIVSKSRTNVPFSTLPRLSSFCLDANHDVFMQIVPLIQTES